MNKQDKQKRINECMRLLDNSFRKDINSVRINTTNTIEHETAKLKVCYELIKSGKKILTEVVFKGGGRADVLVMENFRVYEILHSETEKEALSKIDRYPKELEIMFIKTSEVN